MKKSQIVQDLGVQSIPVGPTQPLSDADNQLREKASAAQVANWKIYQGAVQYAIPGLGWQRVAIANGNGVVVASSGGRTDSWGAKLDQPYQAGAQVIVAVDELTYGATIIGQLPPTRVDPTTQFDQPTFVGSWSDVDADVVAQLYMTAADAGGALTYENGQSSDHHASDYRVMSSTGVQLFVSPLEAGMTADDVTGLWINLLDQSVELSGRQLSLEADGVSLVSELEHPFAKLQLGGELKYHGDPELSLNSSTIEELRTQDLGFVYKFDQDESPTELFTYNLYSFTDAVARHLTGTMLTTSDGDLASMAPSASSSYPSLSVIEHPPGADDEESEWYPTVGSDAEARKELSTKLESWLSSRDHLHFSRMVFAVAEVGKEWVKGASHYLRHEKSEAGGSSDVVEAFRKSETIQRVPQVAEDEEDARDPVFRGATVTDAIVRAGFIVEQKEDGSLFLGNEHGAGIRICGTGVFIEGGTVRVAATKDVSVLGRDVNVITNRDFTGTARKHIRLFSDKNVTVTGGVSGEGGVLVDSRGSNREVELPDNAQDLLYSGVAIKAATSQVVLYGGDVVAAAGASGSGSLVLRSDGGNMLLATAYTAVIHSGGTLLTYGTETSPSQAHLLSGSQVIVQGDVACRNGWFAGAVSAASNIQSFRGRMADSQGGQIGKVQEVERFNEGIRSFAETLSQSKQNWLESGQQLKERLVDSPRALSRKVREELSGGFVQSSKEEEHYGTADMQPTYMAVYQSDWGIPLEPLRSLQIGYKSGSSGSSTTNSWPGRTNAVQINTPIGARAISQRVDDLLSGNPQELETQDLNFEFVFRTLAEE